MPTAGIEFDAHGRPMRVRKSNKDKDRDNRSLISNTSSRRHRDSSVSSSRTPIPLDSFAQSSEFTIHNANVDQSPDVKDNRSVILSSGSSSSGSRKHRDPSASSSRTSVTPDCSNQTSDSSQQNVNVEQLPELPESGPDSPSSANSPMNRTISNVSTSATVVSQSMQHPLPASVQPYLAPYCESVVDLADFGSSQATPKAERPKEFAEVKPAEAKPNLPKTSSPISSPDSKALVHKSSSESVKTAFFLSEQSAPPARAQQQKKPIPQKFEDSKQDPRVKAPPAAPVPYGVGPAGEQLYYPPQLAYLPTHQAISPPSVQNALASQALSHYAEYRPPKDHHPPPQIIPPEAPQAPAPAYQGQWDRGPTSMGVRSDENTMALFHRISCAIPDLHTLMSLHHETCGVLEASHLHIRDQELRNADQVRQLEIRIIQMEKDLDSMSRNHSSEASRLKSETRSLEKRCKELQQKVTAGGKHNETLQATNEILRAEQKESGRKYQEYEKALNEAFNRDKDRMVAEQRTNHRAMQDELQAHTRIADANLSKRLAEERRAHEEEKQALEHKWYRQKRELEDRQAKVRRDLEESLEAKQKVVDEERRAYLQAREGWDKERETLTRKWEEERLLLQKASEDQQKSIAVQHQREKDALLKQSTQSRNSNEAEEYIQGLQMEIDRLKSGWSAETFKFQNATADFKTTARTLNEQNNKLQALMEAFGQETEKHSTDDRGGQSQARRF